MKPGGMSSAPGGLEIETADWSVKVEDFAGKV
jgi:hypothetical protein